MDDVVMLALLPVTVALLVTIAVARTRAYAIPGTMLCVIGVVMAVGSRGDANSHEAAGAFGALGATIAFYIGLAMLGGGVICLVLGAALHDRPKPTSIPQKRDR